MAVIAKGGERVGKYRRDQACGPAGEAHEGGRGGGEEEEALLAVGDDSMGPEEFARAVYHCGDLKTWDGMCSVSQVFFVYGSREVYIHRRKFVEARSIL